MIEDESLSWDAESDPQGACAELCVEAVTIGRGSVVGARSVVTRDGPAGVVVAGNPARVVKELEKGE